MKSRWSFFFALTLFTAVFVTLYRYQTAYRHHPAPSPILIVSSFRAGGGEVTRTLSHYYNAPIIDYRHFDQFIKRRGLCNYRGLPQSKILAAKKAVLHIRDPRESLLSSVFYLDRLEAHDQLNRAPSALLPPHDYFSWGFDEKIDWQIENYYLNSISWIEKWLAYFDALEDVDVLITTYDQMKREPLKMYREIIDFYGGKGEKFQVHHLPMGNSLTASRHLRGSDAKDWREALNIEQQERVNALLPQKLIERFQWE